VLSEATGDGRYAKAIQALVARVQADTFDEKVKTILAKRLDVSALLASEAQIAETILVLKRQAGLLLSTTEEELLGELLQIDEEGCRLAVKILKNSTTKKDLETAAALEKLLSTGERLGRIELCKELYLTKELKPRKPPGLLTKALGKQHPAALACLVAEQERICRALERISLLKMLEATHNLLMLTSGILQEYDRMKRQRGLYDFTDLIEKTRELLTVSSSASWVLYKLDGGIDHVLIDEAQDTSRAQWEIARAITEEFFSGRGARADTVRTLFVVGDRKQSIFSFQGADPASFDESRHYFQSLIKEAGLELSEVELFDSFRTVPCVLRAVDGVFARLEARTGLEEDVTAIIRHYATRQNVPGRVELWPLVEVDRPPKPHPLDPVDKTGEGHARRVLAKEVARKIKGWIGRRTLASSGRTVSPDDILILVKSRNLFFESMIAELNKLGVPVAGADRLRVGEHIAVRDLLALARFVLLPDDDLSLAEILKSPVMPVALDEDELFSLAHGRNNESLWQRFRAGGYPLQVKFLEQMIALAERTTPFEFFSHVLLLGEPSGRQRIFERLGPESGDALDAFLARCMEDELHDAPSLQRFIVSFEQEDIEIKRDMQGQGGVVRIMTVHGAKGLEANIVIVPDAADLPHVAKDLQLLMVRQPGWTMPVPFWSFKAGVEPEIVTEWKNATRARLMEEDRRSLYVALTRARDELYIGGTVTRGELKDHSWYALVRTALQEMEGVNRLEDGGLVYVDQGLTTADQETGDVDVATIALPSWLRKPPSRALSERPWVRPTDSVRRLTELRGRNPLDRTEIDRFRRGTLIHKLLQFLPDLPPVERRATAVNFLKRHHTAEDEIPELCSEVLGLMEDPRYRAFFADGSLAEVPFAWQESEGGKALSGRIDRLAVTADAVHLIDFKTDRWAPRSLAGVDPAYLAQLRAYAVALRAIYPGRRVTAGLLWTVEPRLMAIPEDLLV
jgi:ATP-dependent helicase/nuclease subunit A